MVIFACEKFAVFLKTIAIVKLSKYYSVLLYLLAGSTALYGQQPPSNVTDANPGSSSYFPLSDSIITASKDTVVFFLDTISENLNNGNRGASNGFYETLRRSANKSKFTKELYNLFFVSPEKPSATEPMRTERSEIPFVQYQGKTIRKIRIKILQPFGPKLSDTTIVTTSWLEKKGNDLHHPTRERSIRRQLHIKPGDKVTALDLVDNERLIRELPYIKDAFFQVIPVKENPIMVDLELLVKDQFSWGLNIDASSISSFDFEVYNRNVYGRGHQLNNSLQYDSDEKQKFGYTGEYFIKNLAGSFLNTGLTYQNTYEKAVVQLDVFKEFETFTTKYAGGAVLSRTMRSDKIEEDDPILSEVALDFNFGSFWIGRAFQLKSDNLFTRKRIVAAASVATREFFKRPFVSPEENKFFHNNTLYLTSFSLTKTQFYKSNLIYNFGRTEDIPYGYLAQLTFGYENREFSHRKYLGVRFENANYFFSSKCYLFYSFAIGGFFKEERLEQGVVTVQGKYVSKLKQFRRYRLRNFADIRYILGIRRFPGEFIDLNKTREIRGFYSPLVQGNQKLVLNLESVAFSPYMVGGFRLAFFSFADMGIIGSNRKLIFNEDFYCGFGLGLKLRNENLVFKTIQLRFAFYPNAPRDFKSREFRLSGESRPRFNDFITGQPKVLEYQ